MRQIYIPLVFLECKLFISKSDFLQAHSMLKKIQNFQSLVENDNSIPGCVLIPPSSNGLLANKTMEKPVVASE